jgi:hypothetical protein
MSCLGAAVAVSRNSMSRVPQITKNNVSVVMLVPDEGPFNLFCHRQLLFSGSVPTTRALMQPSGCLRGIDSARPLSPILWHPEFCAGWELKRLRQYSNEIIALLVLILGAILTMPIPIGRDH